MSGFHWDNERGAGIEGEAAANVWNMYMEKKVRFIFFIYYTLV